MTVLPGSTDEWHRHTGQWFRHFSSVTLEEALRLIEKEGPQLAI
jgi:hypothetical protein